METLLVVVAVAVAVVVATGILLVLAYRRRVAAVTNAVHEERRRRQAELDQREEYVATAARELMNPIAAISYAARALQAERTTLDVASVAQGIAAEAAGASELIRGLLDAARAEAGRLHLALAPIDLLEIVRTTLERFNPGPQHSIVLVTPYQELPVRGDPGALANVLRHLLGNAVAYGRPGEVRVEVETAADGRVAIIGVRDSGPGVPESERPLLFQKFARLSTAGGTPGAGLGLYLSRAIVEEHGGVLSVEWPSDGGSRFWFTLPAAIRPEGGDLSVPNAASDQSGDAGFAGKVVALTKPISADALCAAVRAQAP